MPMEFQSADDVLDYAIHREEEAAAFYERLAERAERESMRRIFLEFAGEEKGHRAKLMAVKKGQKLQVSRREIRDLKIADYLADVDPEEELDYQQALVLAMKAEKEAYRLYLTLADSAEETSLRELFLDLAQEEAKHKLRFEIEYDDRVLRDN
jgi:rubrerythrin